MNWKKELSWKFLLPLAAIIWAIGKTIQNEVLSAVLILLGLFLGTIGILSFFRQSKVKKSYAEIK